MQSGLGRDGAADSLGCAGDAVPATARDVDLHLAGRGDDECGVGLALVDLRAGGGVVANFGDRQRILATDAVDELLGACNGDGHVMQRRLGERAGVAGDHGDDEECQSDHRQRCGADGGAIVHGEPIGGLVLSHVGDLSNVW